MFIVLITRAILSFNLNFYIPILKRSTRTWRQPIGGMPSSRQFYFRRNLFPRGHRAGSARKCHRFRHELSHAPCSAGPPTPTGPVEDEYRLMTVNEIINGTAFARASAGVVPAQPTQDGDEFPGLISLVEATWTLSTSTSSHAANSQLTWT